MANSSSDRNRSSERPCRNDWRPEPITVWSVVSTALVAGRFTGLGSKFSAGCKRSPHPAAERILEMSKCLVVPVVALLAGLAISPVLGAQTAAPKAAGEEAKPEKWNSIPPIKPAYAGKKSAPAPRWGTPTKWRLRTPSIGGTPWTGRRRGAARRDGHYASSTVHAFWPGSTQGQ